MWDLPHASLAVANLAIMNACYTKATLATPQREVLCVCPGRTIGTGSVLCSGDKRVEGDIAD